MVLVKISSFVSLFFLVKVSVLDKIQFHVYGIKILTETSKYVMCYLSKQLKCIVKDRNEKDLKKIAKNFRKFLQVNEHRCFLCFERKG